MSPHRMSPEQLTAKSDGYIECVAITIPKHANTGTLWKQMSVIMEKSKIRRISECLMITRLQHRVF